MILDSRGKPYQMTIWCESLGFFVYQLTKVKKQDDLTQILLMIQEKFTRENSFHLSLVCISIKIKSRIEFGRDVIIKEPNYDSENDISALPIVTLFENCV